MGWSNNNHDSNSRSMQTRCTGRSATLARCKLARISCRSLCQHNRSPAFGHAGLSSQRITTRSKPEAKSVAVHVAACLDQIPLVVHRHDFFLEIDAGVLA